MEVGDRRMLYCLQNDRNSQQDLDYGANRVIVYQDLNRVFRQAERNNAYKTVKELPETINTIAGYYHFYTDYP